MSPAKIVGNRLRRYLGALLAIGFGATWWNLVPPAKAAAVAEVYAKPRMVVAPAPRVISFEPEDLEPSIHVSMRLPDPKPRKPHVVTPPVVVVDLLVVPVSVTVPVIPVADPIVTPDPEPDPLPEFVLPPIRTRSS